ncbi:MAG: VanZ family protein, partial [Deltaproteobacteria bacterium]|nr:VanZ family protein [Deltaproteobacteria bacterium]
WLAGGVDELIQWWLPVRVFDVRDIIFNGVAGMLGVALFATGSLKSAPSTSTPSTPLP